MHVKVRVRTAARKESVREISQDHFEISVREKPKHNLANKRVLALIAEHFDVPTSRVRIIKGHHHSSKVLALDNRSRRE